MSDEQGETAITNSSSPIIEEDSSSTTSSTNSTVNTPSCSPDTTSTTQIDDGESTTATVTTTTSTTTTTTTTTEAKEEYPVAGFESVQGRRASMEDAHVSIDDIKKHFDLELNFNEKVSFYGVYDGHGGVEAAVMCEQSLHQSIVKDPAFLQSDFESALKSGFSITDKQVLDAAVNRNFTSGSTVVVILLVGNCLYVANVGDSEAVLAKRTSDSSYEAILLSQKQKPSDPGEKDRIKKAGGHVVFGRVMGSLAVSRAIGDRDFKFPFNKSEADFVSSEPFVNKIELTPDDEFLIIACDGLWDKYTYQQATDFIAKERELGKSPGEAAKDIVKSALDRGTLDNVTTIVVYLRPHVPMNIPPPEKPPEKEEAQAEKTPDQDEVDVYDFLKNEGEKVKARLANQTKNGSPKAKKLFRYFSLPAEEELLQEYTCSLELVYSGLLIITQNFLCFYSASFGRKIQKQISINEIETIRKHKSMIFSPVLTIELQDRKKFAFHWKQGVDRDNAFRKILELIAVQQEKHVTTITTEDRPSKASSNPNSQSDFHVRPERESKDEIVLVTDQKSRAASEPDIQPLPLSQEPNTDISEVGVQVNQESTTETQEEKVKEEEQTTEKELKEEQ